ncbi:MAG: adenylosuccinate synthetase, partial [Oscillospiraceae bacterium]
MKYSERKKKVVIGASYGDEGKGLMTDYFCREANRSGKACLTVLHNGGSQRGHTVSAKDGIRHVFHHLSSGTFASSDTYFADRFIINPMIFADEHPELSPDTKIYCSPNCRWSTPFDMMINQIVEDHRGENRHGSCGFGIWETVFRFHEGNEASFPGFMAMNMAEKTRYLKNIRDKYLPWRLNMLGVHEISDEWKEIIYNDKLIDNYIADCEYFWANTVIPDANILETYPYIVFEG